MMKNLTTYFIVCLFLVSCSPKFTISRLSPRLPSPSYGINEPSIAINPINTNEIAVGTVYRHYFYTKSAGNAWKEDTLFSSFGVRGDPVLQFDDKGALYYFHLANFSASKSLDRIVCQKANSISSKFNNGTYTQVDGFQHDKEAVYFDPETKIFHLTWTRFDKYASLKSEDSSHVLYSYSKDYSANWSVPERVNKTSGTCLDDDNTLEGAISTTDTKGNTHVFWMSKEGIQMNSLLKNNSSWQGERNLLSLKEGWVIEIPGLMRANGFAQVACDKSNGKHRGRIYLSWVDNHADSIQHDVWLMFSDDDGKTWSIPSKVGKDEFVSDQFFSAMTIDQSNGNLHIMYYDISSYSIKEKNQQFDVILASSKNGGEKFNEIKINKTPLSANEDIFFGDYNSISAVKGTIALAYTTLQNNECHVEVAVSHKKMKTRKAKEKWL
jgi:hypothetical protein